MRLPAQLIFIVAISALLIEMSIMALFGQLPGISPLVKSLLDGALLTILLFPILYWFMFRPLSMNIAALERAELLLINQRDHLEDLVQSRAGELTESTRKLTEAQRLAHIGNWEQHPDQDMGYWSDEIYRIFGMARLLGSPTREMFMQAVHLEDRPLVAGKIHQILADKQPIRAEFRVVRPDGTTRFVQALAEVTTAETGCVEKLFGTLQDISDQKTAEERIRFLAYYDSLTGLPNRALISDRIMTAASIARRRRTKFAVLSLNIDRLKTINDSFGLAVGDILLRDFAARLKGCVRDEDSVARLAGDEFLILLQGIEVADRASRTAQRILDKMKEAFRIEDLHIVITVSIGIAVYPEHGIDANMLIKNAEAAMYVAKTSDRGIFRFFTPEMNAKSAERMLLEHELRQALKNDELVVHYQPQLDLATNTLSGFEALVRWQHPARGMISPNQFISLAEEVGLIVQIGEQVMRKVCFQIKQWQKQGLHAVPVAVNVSSVQFRQINFPATVRAALQDSGIGMDCLELELTESLLLSNADVGLNVLGELTKMGLKLLIDDFGTGYSSLSYLKRLPVYKLKIDQSFVQGLPSDQDDVAIVRAIIGIATSLHMSVIAEGVETEAQLDFLRGCGCNEIQGYFYGKPLPSDLATEFLLKRGK
jgi:diguanylate cyclase (GGDEF)-like protein/PAS domain S-box-containing protein